MDRWRATDEQPVTTRQSIAAAMIAVADEIGELARRSGTRPWVIACWQDAEYIGMPVGLPSQLATIGDLLVASAGRPTLPSGAEHVELEHDEPMAAEWSLVAITPTEGIALTAHEIGATFPARTVEAGRAFRYDLTADRAEVVATTERQLRDLGARACPETLVGLRSTVRALGRVAALDDLHTDVDRAACGIAHRVATLVEQVDDDRRARVHDHAGNGGLTKLAEWLTDAGPRAPALGMIVVQATDHTVTATLRLHAELLGRVGDLIVDVPPDAAMLVVPDLVGSALQARASTIRDELTDALGTQVRAIGVEVPAVEARHDLVDSLSRALATLRGTEMHVEAA